jgi:NO-binding membrane sensor protein with MHYT domain/signal transduction histidine kinase/CheY-like chemotaxis protein
MPLSGAHDTALVVLSVLIAIFASYTALDLASRIRSSVGHARQSWLLLAAVAMGGGVWSMHFVAMLSFSMPVDISYDLGLTILSLVLPIAVTAIGFAVMSRREANLSSLTASGLLMGGGIATMHYTGMAAMRMPADLRHDSLWVGVSVLIAIGASVAGLWLAFRGTSPIRKILASAVMGIAVSGMHYTAMHATTFTAHVHFDAAQGNASLGQTNLALAVALITCLILGLALSASIHFRKERAHAARDIAKAIPDQQTGWYFALLITASILLPFAVLALASWQNWRQLEVNAEDRARKRVNLVAEHALKVLQNNEQVLRRADEEMRKLTLDEIRGSYQLNSYLNRLVEDIDHLDGIGVIGPDGRLEAVSQAFPALPLDLSKNDYFTQAPSRSRRSFVSAPARAHQRDRQVFRLSHQRTGPDERPSGVLFASMSLDYFVQFYRSITDGLDSVTMARSDGTVIIRDPPVTTGLGVMGPESGFMRSIARSDRGIYRTVSELDGIGRIHAFQRVGAYPIYVSYGFSLETLNQEWRSNLVAFGVVAVLAALALSTLSLFSLRRANQEHRIYLRWQLEAERRELAEDALRQAQKMEAVGQLTGGIAHDFNNLLTVVIGNLDFAGRALEKSNIPKAHRNIESALLGAQRAAALTHRLLAFSRRQPLQPQVVNLNTVVAGMSDLFRRTLGESIRVETVLAGGLWNTWADPNQLESALLNLVINARDAMPHGGRLTIETANCLLDDAYASAHAEVEPGQYVMVAVTDTGTGMTQGVLERVFEPFFTTKDVGQGTGLGLSMIYGFVKQTGGHVKIYSEPGQGTTVKIYLARTYEVAADAPARAQAPGAQSGEVVLVVEDDPNVRTYTVESLTNLGYRVLEAQDASSALAVLDSHPEVRLLFTDVGLPGPNGRQLAEEAQQRRPGLRVLYMSGYTRNAIVHNGVLDPGVNLLNKPFTTDQLAAKVRQVLEAEPAKA